MSINGTFEVRHDSLWGYSTIMDSGNKCFTMQHRRDCYFLKGPPLAGGYYIQTSLITSDAVLSYTDLLYSARHTDRNIYCTDTSQKRPITEKTDRHTTRMDPVTRQTWLEIDQHSRLTTKSHRISLYRAFC